VRCPLAAQKSSCRFLGHGVIYSPFSDVDSDNSMHSIKKINATRAARVLVCGREAMTSSGYSDVTTMRLRFAAKHHDRQVRKG